MIKFNDRTHKVTIAGITITLKPLSIKLLERLYLSKNECVSAFELEQFVWQGKSISPEALKQRIFVLRKALADAGITEYSIQAERGQGYRLLQHKNTHTVSALHHRRSFILSLSLLVPALLLGVFLLITKTNKDYTAVNNRMVLWTNIAPGEMTTQARNYYEQWRSILSNRNNKGDLQLIYTKRNETIPIQIQARKDRAGLVSYFEVVLHNHKTAVRLQIIEPRTATILSSNLILFPENEYQKKILDQQVNGILNLFKSQKLSLSKEQKNDASDPVWTQLRQLANPS